MKLHHLYSVCVSECVCSDKLNLMKTEQKSLKLFSLRGTAANVPQL